MRSILWLVLPIAACVEPLELGETQHALNVVSTFQTTAYDGSSTKTLELQCPLGYLGTQVSFIGLSATGHFNLLEDLVTATYPNATGDRWRVVARDLQNDPSWALQAHLACVEPGSSYELVSGESQRELKASREVELACPAGKVVLGAAFSPTEHFRNGPAARATYSMPASNGSSWVLGGRAVTTGEWNLRATIVCYDALDLPDYQVVKATEPPVLGPLAYSVARCPTPLLGVTGGGWTVRDRGGSLVEGTAYYDERWPANGHPIQFPGSWEMQINLFSGFAKKVEAEGAVICI